MMLLVRNGLALALLAALCFPTSSLAASKQRGGHRSQRRLAQNRQQPPDWVNDVYHCSNPFQVNFIESDVFCDTTTFQWDLSLLEPFAYPGICSRVNYTEIYELSFIQGALSDFQKPCYWWNIMYGSMAPSATPSTSAPSTNPTMVPSNAPSLSPTLAPSSVPSDFPTGVPSLTPSSSPTSLPSVVPSTIPSTLVPSIPPTLLPTGKPTLAPVAAPVKQTSKPTSKPVSQRPTTYETTYSPTLTAYPTAPVTTFSPTIDSTVDRNGVLVRPLANFVIAYSVGGSGSLRRGRAQRHLLSVNRYQLTALTATYLIEQLKTAFPNSQVKTVALVLTSVSAEVAVAHNASTNTSTSTSTFQEALSGEIIFGTTQTSLVPVLHDLYDSIQNSFTDSTALKTYFRILQGSRDPVLKRISRVSLVQGVSYVNTTATTDTPSNATSSSVTAQTNQGFKWSVTLIAIVASAGVATVGVAFLVYLCITHKSRKRRRRLRKQQREQRQKEVQKAKEAEKARKSAAAAERTNRTSSRPSALDTSNNTKPAVPSRSRRWFSWGGADRSAPDLALQPTSSVNSSPLSMITTPRTTSDSPVKTASSAVAQAKRRTVKEFDELVSDDGNDDECFRSAADEDQSEVASTYSYIETNTNDDHSISVAPSFLYGPNETGSIMGDYDDFGELVGAATKRIHRTPWIDDLSLQSKAAAWTSVNSKKAPPLPPSRNASAPPILKAANTNILSSPTTTQASQDPNNSHLLDVSESYGSFYEYDEKKGIMIISRPVEDLIPIDGDMPSKIGTSFGLEDSFFSQEGSQTDAMLVIGDKGEVSALGSPSRIPGMDSGGSLFLNSPSTSFSTGSPRKAPIPTRNQQPSVSVDEQAIGEVLQFYEGTTSATSTSTTPSPVKAKKFAFGEVWRDIVEEDVDDHVRDSTSVSSQGRSPASPRKVVSNDASPSLSRKLNRSDGSVHSTSSLSQRAASKETSSSPKIDSSFQSLNRSGASPRKSSTPLGSKGTDPSYYLHSPDKHNRSDASSRMSLTPGSSKNGGASSSPADRFDDYADDDDFPQGTRVSFSSSLNNTAGARPPSSPAANEARSQETTTRRWLASQANEQKNDGKPQSRSKSVAPPAGHRQRGPTATSTMTNSKRSSSLPPSRHASLHRVKEDLPLDDGVKNWSPREHRIDEASSGNDDVGTKLSI